MINLLNKYLSYALLITIILISSSCKRKNTCNKGMFISGPHYVVEGESFTLKPINYDEVQYTNTNYYWTYPESTGWAYSSGNSEEFLEPESISVSKADKRHEGLYYFTIDSGNHECNYDDGIAVHEVKIAPKTCPCFNNISTNQIIIDDSNENEPLTYNVASDYELAWDSTEFRVEPLLPMFSYSIYVDFHLHPPDYSSTYKLKGTDSWSIEEPLIQAKIHFQPHYTANNYILDGEDQEIFFKREDDGFYLTFCNVNFVNEIYTNRTATISGKIKIYQ